MRRRRPIAGGEWFRFLLALAFFIPMSVAAADEPNRPEPPVRLKKKARPKAEAPATEKKSEPEKKSEKDAGKAKSEEDELRFKKAPDKVRLPGQKGKAEGPGEDLKEPGQDPKEVLARVNKNMRASEDRLAKKDAGDGTQQVQRDIIKDLDALIEQTRRQQQQQRAQRMSRNQQRTQRRQNQRDVQQQAEMQPQDQMMNAATGGGRSRGDRGKIADLYKDIWGHLPETLRQEMDAYSRERFMAKYNDLLKQYYSTISEKGRQKGD